MSVRTVEPQRRKASMFKSSLTASSQVASILRYLGEHVTLLTSMNLRDYLYLKVRCQHCSSHTH